MPHIRPIRYASGIIKLFARKFKTMLKVTALKDISIYANVVSQQPVSLLGALAFKPKNSMEWVDMTKGEVREDISMVVGLDPDLMPHKQAIVVGPNLFAVPLEETAEFRALLRMETAGD